MMSVTHMKKEIPYPSDREKSYFPFPVPDHRFDQRKEMFKRRTWDDEFISQGNRLFTQVKYQDKYGYRKLDYALQERSLEHRIRIRIRQYEGKPRPLLVNPCAR